MTRPFFGPLIRKCAFRDNFQANSDYTVMFNVRQISGEQGNQQVRTIPSKDP
jgi:hypothetical protein